MFRKSKRKNLSIEDIRAQIEEAKIRIENEQQTRIERSFQEILRKLNRGQFKINSWGRIEIKIPLYLKGRYDGEEQEKLIACFADSGFAIELKVRDGFFYWNDLIAELRFVEGIESDRDSFLLYKADGDLDAFVERYAQKVRKEIGIDK